MDRERIRSQVQQHWTNLVEILQALSRDELEATNVVGIWSPRDLISHLESWDRIAIDKLDAAERGETLHRLEIENQAYESIDEFNEADVEANRHKSMTELWTELQATHAELMDRLQSSPALTDDLISEDTYKHYAGHLDDILAWKTGQSPVAERNPPM